jgi:Rrf2 family protein
MEISRKTDYALRMIAELVRHPNEILSVRAAAEANDVPYSFARSIQHDLAKQGLIESVRGSHGGMRLATDPDTTTLLEVVEAIQGRIPIESCATAGPDGTPCPRMSTCHFHPVWSGANEVLAAFFDSVTLSEVVDGTGHPHLPQRYAEPDAFSCVPVAELFSDPKQRVSE